MAEGYSIFDKLPKSTLGIAETILSPAAAALSPMSITNTQTEPTGIGKKTSRRGGRGFSQSNSAFYDWGIGKISFPRACPNDGPIKSRDRL